MTRIAVIGSTGQLGTEIASVLARIETVEVLPLSHAALEVTDESVVHRVLKQLQPHVVVNCAACVRVDDCEGHPGNAFRVNALGALYVARACEAVGATCVFISTDYVFDGRKGAPYTEDDSPLPINVYGASKFAGELLVRQSCRRWLIVRVASLFGKTGARGKGGNFVETILSRARASDPIQVVDDITISPTYAVDAAMALERIIKAQVTGVVHIVNSGTCTWYELARTACEMVGLQVRLTPIPAGESRTLAVRPRNSSLASVREVAGVNGHLRAWQDALHAYLEERGYI